GGRRHAPAGARRRGGPARRSAERQHHHRPAVRPGSRLDRRRDPPSAPRAPCVEPRRRSRVRRPVSGAAVVVPGIASGAGARELHRAPHSSPGVSIVAAVGRRAGNGAGVARGCLRSASRGRRDVQPVELRRSDHGRRHRGRERGLRRGGVSPSPRGRRRFPRGGAARRAAAPLETETARFPARGVFEADVVLEVQQSGDGRESALPLAFEYGVTDRLTLMAEPVPFTRIHPKSAPGATGIGDLEVTLSGLLLPETHGRPAFALAGEVKVPTAESMLIGSDQYDYAGYLIASKRFSKLDAHVNFGYTI